MEKEGSSGRPGEENTLKQAESTVGERQVTTATEMSPSMLGMHAWPQVYPWTRAPREGQVAKRRTYQIQGAFRDERQQQDRASFWDPKRRV